MPMTAKKKAIDPPIKPIRVKPGIAAKMLGVGYQYVLDLIVAGTFTVFDSGKRGRGRRLYLLTEEVELYGREGEEALKEHRAKHKRNGKAKR